MINSLSRRSPQSPIFSDQLRKETHQHKKENDAPSFGSNGSTELRRRAQAREPFELAQVRTIQERLTCFENSTNRTRMERRGEMYYWNGIYSRLARRELTAGDELEDRPRMRRTMQHGYKYSCSNSYARTMSRTHAAHRYLF